MTLKPVIILLLAIYLIAMIDSGSSLRCYEVCNIKNKDCFQGIIMNCSTDSHHCGYFGINRKCIKDSELAKCQGEQSCQPCQTDICNKV